MKTQKLDPEYIKNAINYKLASKKILKPVVVHDKNEYKELFINKEEKEAILMQSNFNVLHNLVENFKKNINEVESKYEFEAGDHTKITEEIFDLLNYRGVIDPKHFHKIKAKNTKVTFDDNPNVIKIESCDRKKLDPFNLLYSPIEKGKYDNIQDKRVEDNVDSVSRDDKFVINLINCSDASGKETSNVSVNDLSKSVISSEVSDDLSCTSYYSEVSNNFDVEDNYD